MSPPRCVQLLHVTSEGVPSFVGKKKANGVQSKIPSAKNITSLRDRETG